MNGLREVDKATYYEAIGDLPVVGVIMPGPWPYTTEHRTASGRCVGRRVGSLTDGGLPVVFRYYLPAEGE